VSELREADGVPVDRVDLRKRVDDGFADAALFLR
jgi:hypothetical protein